MNWLLIIVVAILLISTFRGYQTGLIKTVFALVSLIVSIIVASIVSPVVSKSLQENKEVTDYMHEKLENVIPYNEEEKIEKSSEETKYIEELKLPKCIKTTLLENNHKEVYKALGAKNFHEYIIGLLTVVIINTISYALCFLVVWMILFIVSRILNVVSKLPLVNEINKLAGLLAGIISGVVKIWIFFIAITLFSTSSVGVNIFEQINQSPLLSFLYDNNILMQWITNITKTLF